jgi:hypothetical protein
MFLRNEVFEEFKEEFKLPKESFFAILKVDDNKYSYLIDGLHEVKCNYDIFNKYSKKLHSNLI